MEILVGLAGRVAFLDPLVGPGLPAGGRRRLGVMDPLLGPGDRKPRVQDAARIESRLRGIEHRERRDRGQARRVGLGGEQLADPAVGDSHHPDLVMESPRLARDRLDHVVPVEALQRLEEVEGATRAAGAAHVDVDHREAHQVGEDGDPALRTGRVRVPVARVLDQGRSGPRGERRQLHAGQHLRHVLRRMHVHGQLGAVAGGHIAVAAGGDGLVVDGGARRSRLSREHGQRARCLPARGGTHAVAGSRRHAAEQDAPQRVGLPGGDGLAGAVQQRHLRARSDTGHVDLLHAAARGERGRGGGPRRGHQHDRHHDGTRCDPNPRPPHGIADTPCGRFRNASVSGYRADWI